MVATSEVACGVDAPGARGVRVGHLAPAAFFVRRWRGEVPLTALFWRDMIVVGSAVNLAASFAALMLAAQGAPLGLAVALHFAPLPYNLFLVAAVWRMPARTAVVSVAAGLWLAVATLI